MSAIKSLNLRKGIVTSRTELSLREKLGTFIEEFEVVITPEYSTKHKPDPEPLLVACKKMGVDPKEVVYVGDMMVDYMMSKQAGADFIGFVFNGSTREEFERAGVNKIIESHWDLEKIVNRS